MWDCVFSREAIASMVGSRESRRNKKGVPEDALVIHDDEDV
jgi:hypothetical protein